MFSVWVYHDGHARCPLFQGLGSAVYPKFLDKCHELLGQSESKLVLLDCYTLKLLLQFCIALIAPM